MFDSSASSCSSNNSSSNNNMLYSPANSRSCSSSSSSSFSSSEYMCNSSWLDYAIYDGSIPDFISCEFNRNIVNDGSTPACSRSPSSSGNDNVRFTTRCVDVRNSPTDNIRAAAVSGSRVFTAHQSGEGQHFIRVWSRRQPATKVFHFSDADSGISGAHDALQYKLLATLPTARERFTKRLNQKNYVQIRRHHRQLWIQHADAIASLAVDETRRILFSGSWDKTVKVWDMDRLRCVESISAHDDAVNAVAVSQQHGFLYTASADGSIKVWRQRHFSKKLKHVLIATLSEGHKPGSAINAVVLSDDGECLFSAASDGGICVWGISKGQIHISQLLHSFQNAHRLPILSLAYCKTPAGDRLLLSGSADKTIKAWCINAGDDKTRLDCVGVLEGHSGAVRNISITDEAAEYGAAGVAVCSASSDGSTRIWWLGRV